MGDPRALAAAEQAAALTAAYRAALPAARLGQGVTEKPTRIGPKRSRVVGHELQRVLGVADRGWQIVAEPGDDRSDQRDIHGEHVRRQVRIGRPTWEGSF